MRKIIGASILGYAVAITALCFLLFSENASAWPQIGDVFDVGEVIGEIPGLDIGFGGEDPITTSFDDAITSVPFMDDFAPSRFFPACEMPEGPGGWGLIHPGSYQDDVWSYCLHAGTHGPSGGDGYLLAPLKGKRAGIIQKIMDGSIEHLDIPQRDIQTLIWAVLARTKISDMNTNTQMTAAKLLSEKDLFELQGGALGLVPDDAWDKVFGELPSGVRKIYEAEAKLRQAMTSGTSTFEELEAIAVLPGEPPKHDGPVIPSERWSYHPDGYFIRYAPSGYSDMHLEITVPDICTVERDEQNRIIGISNDHGTALNISYDDAVDALKFKGGKNARGWAFKSVVLTRMNPLRPWETDEVEWRGEGWTIVGRPGKGKPSGSPSGRFDNAGERVKLAVEVASEMKLLFKDAPKSEWKDECIENTFDLAMLSYAIKEITGYEAGDGEAVYEATEMISELAVQGYGLSDSSYMSEITDKLSDVGTRRDAVCLVYEAAQDQILSVMNPPNDGKFIASSSLSAESGFSNDFYSSVTGHDRSMQVAAGETAANVRSSNQGFSYMRNTLSFSHSTGVHFFSGTAKEDRARRFREMKQMFGKGEFKPRGVASPANRDAQRLAISGRRRNRGELKPFNRDNDNQPGGSEDAPKESAGKETFNKAKKILGWFGVGSYGADAVVSGGRLATANQVGLGIPNAGASKIVEFNMNKAEEISHALGGDPPRSDFKEIARPEIPVFTPLEPSDVLSASHAAAINEFIGALNEMNAICIAATISLDRHGGAVLAGDEEWIMAQAQAVLYYKRQGGFAMLVTAARLETLLASLRAEGVTDITVSEDSIRRYQNRLRTSGWNADELEAARTLGLSAEQMDWMLQRRINADPAEASGNILEHSEAAVGALRGMGAYLIALPVVDQP